MWHAYKRKQYVLNVAVLRSSHGQWPHLTTGMLTRTSSLTVNDRHNTAVADILANPYPPRSHPRVYVIYAMFYHYLMASPTTHTATRSLLDYTYWKTTAWALPSVSANSISTSIQRSWVVSSFYIYWWKTHLDISSLLVVFHYRFVYCLLQCPHYVWPCKPSLTALPCIVITGIQSMVKATSL